MSISNTSESKWSDEVLISDTTGTFHDDFDTSFVFNGDCVSYTFKENHICSYAR